ncbi:hypothetical protein IV454_00040 [Massilia antarctica]|uniref:Uncharacterized protein n=1 Tax=Massilia antarctica TaxID=2765360 RepID=A0AA48WEI2_9BURK|nr:hypothetical protein [Massilia antarctica]QPI50047.1 hypothetical protein IV454_32415 [Massilia antarctica]QPI50077.1 hypothetical protein IV454_00040 [Massilia antarctica]
MYDIFINAILANASYADDLVDRCRRDVVKIFAGRANGPVLAEFISKEFSVISHKESGDIVGSGFDATTWKQKSTNKIYISFQGTFGVKGIAADQNGQASNYRVFFGAGAGRDSGRLV